MIYEADTTVRLVLASVSPRRRRLIRALDMPVELASPDGDEGAAGVGETASDFVTRLSLEKARGIARGAADAVVLGADTAVELDGEVLGKPANAAEAVRMLRALRGRVHRVVTGVTALDARSGRWLSATKCSTVRMRDYSDDEMAAYVASGKPMDKAGAYAVQDAEFSPAEAVEGCYLNAVGLPLCEVLALLSGLGMRVRLKPDWRPSEQCRGCSLEERQEVSRA